MPDWGASRHRPAAVRDTHVADDRIGSKLRLRRKHPGVRPWGRTGRRGLFPMLAVINTPHEDKQVALREVEEPTPAPNEALVQVAAFSLNRGELAQLNRLEHGWRPGQDVAGTILSQASDGSG